MVKSAENYPQVSVPMKIYFRT